jgi:hypothetical protein
MRERMRQQIAERMGAAGRTGAAGPAGGGAPPLPREPEWSALCQALLLSGEFRTVD